MAIDRNHHEGGGPARTGNPLLASGIYLLPAVGGFLVAARRFFDEVAPMEGDSTGVRGGKEALRWGAVAVGAVAGGGVMAIVAL